MCQSSVLSYVCFEFTCNYQNNLFAVKIPFTVKLTTQSEQSETFVFVVLFLLRSHFFTQNKLF